MAKIIENYSELTNDYKAMDRKVTALTFFVVLGYVLVAFYAIMIFTRNFSFEFAAAVIIYMGITKQIIKPMLKKAQNECNIIESGISGESRVQNRLSALPDSYTVIHNIVVDYDGQKNELDFVVVGPNGVFVIENKNNGGYIYGDAKDNQLSQQKNYGTKTFRNPVKQVGMQTYRLRGLFNKLGINQWIQPVVYFSNPEAQVSISNCEIPVFTTSDLFNDSIVKYITEYNNGRTVSPLAKTAIVSALTNTKAERNVRTASTYTYQSIVD